MSIVLNMLPVISAEDLYRELGKFKPGEYKLVAQGYELSYIAYEGSINFKVARENEPPLLFTVIPENQHG